MWRLVHLPDAEKRKELMFIYIESLDAMGTAAADLEPGGKTASRWPELERGLIERAAERVKVPRLPDECVPRNPTAEPSGPAAARWPGPRCGQRWRC